MHDYAGIFVKRLSFAIFLAMLFASPSFSAGGRSIEDHVLETEHFTFHWRSLTSPSYPDGVPIGFDLAPGDTVGNPRLVRQLAEGIEHDRNRIIGWNFRVPTYKPAFYLGRERDITNTLTGNITIQTNRAGEATAAALAPALAHEFFHTCQKQYYSAITPGEWLEEGTAAWIEDRLYPNSNSCYPTNVNAYELYHQQSLTELNYGAMPFFLYLASQYGDDIVRDVWDRTAAGVTGSYGVTALRAALRERGTSLEEAWRNFLVAYWSQIPFHPDVQYLVRGNSMTNVPVQDISHPVVLNIGPMPFLSGRAYSVMVMGRDMRNAQSTVTAKLESKDPGATIYIYEWVGAGRPAREITMLVSEGEEENLGRVGRELLVIATSAAGNDAASSAKLILTYAQQASLGVRVTDEEDGEEIGGASVNVTRTGGTGPPVAYGANQVSNATTDASGAATVPRIVVGNYRLRISAPGYKPVTRSIIIKEGENSENVSLEPILADLVVRVRSAVGGVAVRRAEVSVTSARGGGSGTTSERGTVRVRGLRAGAYHVEASAERFLPGEAEATVRVGSATAREPLVNNVTVSLPPAPVPLTLRAADSVTGQVIRGATFVVGDGDASEQVSAPDGITTIERPPGRWQIRASAEGYNPLSKTVNLVAPISVPFRLSRSGGTGLVPCTGRCVPKSQNNSCSCRTWGKCAMPTCVNDRPEETTPAAGAGCSTDANRAACRTNARSCPCPSYGVCGMSSCRNPNVSTQGTPCSTDANRAACRTNARTCPCSSYGACGMPSCRDAAAEPTPPEGPRCTTQAELATCRTNARSCPCPSYGVCGQASCREGPPEIDPGAMRITSPSSRTTIREPSVTVTGTVENREVHEITLNVNGSPRTVPVTNGQFSSQTPLIRGENTIQATAGSRSSNAVTVTAEIVRAAIWSELTWGGPGDIDFHLYLPNGDHCYFSNKSIGGAVLDVDNQSGYGPEHITMENAPPGEYRLSVLYYSGSGETPPPVSWRVTIRLRDGEVQQSFSGTLGSVKSEQTVTSFRF